MQMGHRRPSRDRSSRAPGDYKEQQIYQEIERLTWRILQLNQVLKERGKAGGDEAAPSPEVRSLRAQIDELQAELEALYAEID